MGAPVHSIPTTNKIVSYNSIVVTDHGVEIIVLYVIVNMEGLYQKSFFDVIPANAGIP